MPSRITTDVIDSIKDMVFSTANEYALRLPNARYCDIRVEVDDDLRLVAV